MKLGNLDLTLKNVKTFQGWEGVGLNADIYVNGKKCCFYIDDANGGGGMVNYIHNKELNDLLETEIAKQPKVPYDFGENFKGESTFDIDYLMDSLFKEYEMAKFQKKIDKLCNTAIVWGVPNSDRYTYINLKKPVSSYPKDALQAYIKDNIKLAENEIIFNTNI